MVKGLWSIIFSLPVFVIVIITRDPQALVTYTGGICGTFILMLFPVTLVYFGRMRGFADGKYNFNNSPFQSIWWMILVVAFAFITLFFVILSIVNGTAGE